MKYKNHHHHHHSSHKHHLHFSNKKMSENMQGATVTLTFVSNVLGVVLNGARLVKYIQEG